MARPAVEQEKLLSRMEEFKKLMAFYPSRTDVAHYFDTSESSVDRFIKKNFKMSFDDFRDKSFGTTRISLRQKQIDMALRGDRTMLVWLGKQYLGQSEKIETKDAGPIDPNKVTKIQLNWGDEPGAASNSNAEANPPAAPNKAES